MLTGTYQHIIDSKGRLAIPSMLRKELGESFLITAGVPDKEFGSACLAAYSKKSWDNISARFNEMDREEKVRMRPIFSLAFPYELDGQGRVLLPQNIREWAGLKKNVAIVGAGDSIEIWDAEVWDKIFKRETSQENVAKLYKELNF